MADFLYGGSLSSFADSMAREIEKALVEARQEAGLPPLPSVDTANRRERRTLFIAISRGVIRHLANHQAALEIKFNVANTDVSTFPNIQVKP
jgi:hypothetical protein